MSNHDDSHEIAFNWAMSVTPPVKTYRATFTGRKVNATGITYKIETTVRATSKDKARIRLYDRFEHISSLTLEDITDV